MQPTPQLQLVHWTPEKQQRLQEQLVGFWAEDTWRFPHRDKKRGQRSLHFLLVSPSLNIEFKYAVWQKFARGQRKLESNQDSLCTHLTWLMQWFNQVAPSISSLLEKSLDYWIVSLRSSLMQTGRLRRRTKQRLIANQEYHELIVEDPRIGLLRSIYTTISDAYDDRPETEKDIWDMRKMGLAVNPTNNDNLLNFTRIGQFWLYQLAKAFLKYETAVQRPGCCQIRLYAIQSFSHFLAQYPKTVDPSGIDRTLIVDYISWLRDQGISEGQRRKLLLNLRVFLEGCAYRLKIAELTKERIIFDDDLPKEPQPVPREIPEEVVQQLRQHLDELPTTLLRMVVILLECGLRISELCSLSLDCLKRDDKQEWYLLLYLWKKKKEHTIPLISQTVIETIQAQQEEVKTRGSQASPYLFPSPRTPQRPFQQGTFRDNLNAWARKANIRNRLGRLYRFTPHQFRHTVGMRLINDDVPIDTISRLFGHSSTRMTERYAQKRLQTLREELQRIGLKRKTINFQGQLVRGDAVANSLEPQLLRKGIRGQTLPVGGCGRPTVMGGCEHANKCLTCVFWLTSTEDLPALKGFLGRAIRLRQRSVEAGNEIVAKQQGQIIPLLQLRVSNLEQSGDGDETLSVEGLLQQLKGELAEMEAGLEEAQEAQLVLAVKQFERRIADLHAQIAALEGAL